MDGVNWKVCHKVACTIWCEMVQSVCSYGMIDLVLNGGCDMPHLLELPGISLRIVYLGHNLFSGRNSARNKKTYYERMKAS